LKSEPVADHISCIIIYHLAGMNQSIKGTYKYLFHKYYESLTSLSYAIGFIITTFVLCLCQSNLWNIIFYGLRFTFLIVSSGMASMSLFYGTKQFKAAWNELALHTAVRTENYGEVVKELENGIDANISYLGKSPMMCLFDHHDRHLDWSMFNQTSTNIINELRAYGAVLNQNELFELFSNCCSSNTLKNKKRIEQLNRCAYFRM